MQHPDTQNRLAVSVNDAVRLSGLGRTKLYQSLSDGSLPSFKIGTRRLIRISALDAWLSSFEAKDNADAA